MNYKNYKDVPKPFKPYLKLGWKRWAKPLTDKLIKKVKTYESVMEDADEQTRPIIQELVDTWMEQIDTLMEDPYEMFIDDAYCNSEGVMIDYTAYYNDREKDVNQELQHLQNIVNKAPNDDLQQKVQETINDKKRHIRNIKSKRSEHEMRMRFLKHKKGDNNNE